MYKGFVRLPRRIFETKWWNQKRIYSETDAIIDLYQSADKKNTVTGSRRAFADRWLWDDKRVHRFLSKLEKEGYISITKSISGTVVTILDFGTSAPPSAPPSDPPSDPPKCLSVNDLTRPSAPPSAPPSDPPSDQPSRAYKNNNIISCLNNKNDKNNNIPPLSPKGETKYDWAVLPEDFRPIVEEWLRYKSERKQSYKPTGFKAFCKKLLQMSDGNPIKAKEIIEQSMAFNYQGIFELKDHADNFANRRPTPAENIRAAQQQHLMEVAAAHAKAKNSY